MTTFNADIMQSELQSHFGDSLETNEDSFFNWLIVQPGKLLELMKMLKENYGFNYLSNLTSVDYEDFFEIIYHLYTIPDNCKIAVKTRVPKNQPQLDSVMCIWPTADWQEREVYDLMGIRFNGHTNLIRILLPDDFEGHPLRKDYKIGGK